jgi:hypothetical protein
MRRIGFLLLLLVSTACRRAEPQAAPAPRALDAGRPSPIAISLAATGCLGTCPVYVVRIHEDGAVDYEGRAHVKVLGPMSDRISDAVVRRLLDTFEAAGFASFHEHAQLLDLPTTILTVRLRGQVNRAQFLGAPAPIERAIDELKRAVDLERWIGRKGEPTQEPADDVLSSALGGSDDIGKALESIGKTSTVKKHKRPPPAK